MKKIISTLLLAALGTSVFAQGDVFDATFLTFSFQNPVIKWGKLEDRTQGQNLKKFYKDRYEARSWGVSLESGTTFYFHNFEPTDGLKFAIAWDFLDLGMNLFRFDDFIIHTYDENGDPFVAPADNNGEKIQCMDLYANYSMNVGPMITFSPVQGLCLDLYGKWRPTVGINFFNQLLFDGVDDRIYVNEGSMAGKNKLKYEEMRIGGSLGTISCGLNVRYEFIMLGVEYITGKMHYAATTDLPQQKMWNQMMRFKLGLVFNDKY